MAAWKKIYVRDEDGVMRALPGIKITALGTLWVAKSVYTFSSSEGRMIDDDWKLAYLKPKEDWGYGR